MDRRTDADVRLNCSLWGRKVRAAFAVVCLVSPSCAHLLQAQRATSDNHRQDLRLSLKSRPEEKGSEGARWNARSDRTAGSISISRISPVFKP
jgi:hypothetical protein